MFDGMVWVAPEVEAETLASYLGTAVTPILDRRRIPTVGEVGVRRTWGPPSDRWTDEWIHQGLMGQVWADPLLGACPAPRSLTARGRSQAVCEPLDPLEAVFDPLHTLLCSHAGLSQGVVGGAITPNLVVGFSTDGQRAGDRAVDVSREVFDGGTHCVGGPSQLLGRALAEHVVDAIPHHQEAGVGVLDQLVSGTVPQDHVEGFTTPCAEESSYDFGDLPEAIEGKEIGRVWCEPDGEEVRQREPAKSGVPVALGMGVKRK